MIAYAFLLSDSAKRTVSPFACMGYPMCRECTSPFSRKFSEESVRDGLAKVAAEVVDRLFSRPSQTILSSE